MTAKRFLWAMGVLVLVLVMLAMGVAQGQNGSVFGAYEEGVTALPNMTAAAPALEATIGGAPGIFSEAVRAELGLAAGDGTDTLPELLSESQASNGAFLMAVESARAGLADPFAEHFLIGLGLIEAGDDVDTAPNVPPDAARTVKSLLFTYTSNGAELWAYLKANAEPVAAPEEE